MYNVFIMVYVFFMIFFMVMFVLIGGYGNWFVLIMIGVLDMVFLCLNNISFWLLLFLFLFFLSSVLVEVGVGIGWIVYLLLSYIISYFGGVVDLVIFSFYLLGVLSIFGVINFIIIIFNMRGLGLSMYRFFLFVWFVFIIVFFLFLLLFVFVGVIIMLLIDRNFNMLFFDLVGGGDLIFF